MRPVIYSLLISLAINTAGLISIDRALLFENRKFEILNQQKVNQTDKDKLFFDFVEAPHTLASHKPETAKKISNRDSLARDRSKNELAETAAPKIEKIGPADQLAQYRAKPSQNPSAASKAQEEIKRVLSQPKKTAKETETKKEAPAGNSKDEVVIPQPQKLEPQKELPYKENLMEQKKQAASRPQYGKRELSGMDRIATQEMSRQKSKGAHLFGMTSFDAMGSDMGVYMKNLKEKIWLSWFPYLSFQYPTDYAAADAVISFTLDPKGEVKIVKVIESYGSPQFTTICVESIQRASGFGAIPKEILALIGKDELEIKFAFHYR